MQITSRIEISSTKISIKSIIWFLLEAFLIFANIAKHSFLFQIAATIFIIICTIYLLNKKIKISKYFYPQLIFIIYNIVLIIAGAAEFPNISYDMVVTISINALLMILIFNFVINEKDINKLIRCYIAASFICSIVILFIYKNTLFTGRLGFSWGSNISTYNLFGIPVSSSGSNGIAFLASIAASMLLYYVIQNKKSILYLLFSAPFIITILASGSRKGILYLCIGILLVLVIMNKGTKRAFLFFVGIISCITLYMVIQSIPMIYQVSGTRFQELIHLFTGNAVDDASINTRISLINMGTEYFLKRPIFGYGLDAFRALCPWAIISDNNYLEILVSSGIIGAIIYYSYVFVILFDYVSIKNKSEISKIMFWLFTIILIMQFGSTTYYERNFDFFNVILFSVLYMNKLKEKTVNG